MSLWLKEQWHLHPEPWRGASEAGTVDDSLTNLQWLQEFSIFTADPERPTVSGERVPQRLPQDRASEAPASPPEGDPASTGMPLRMGTPVSSSAAAAAPCPPPPLLPARAPVDYRTDGRVKPPYSYATLICMAMRDSREAKLALSAIYAWIAENFCYYRHADPSWQNSIRHNLSLNKCFQKVPRRKDEPGKGGFWRINPQYADLLVDGVFRRRRVPALPWPCLHATLPLPRPGPTQPDTTPRTRRRPSKPKQPSANACPRRRAAWTGPPSPPAPVDREAAPALAGDLSWASVLEGAFSGTGSSFEDLELTAALDSLAAEEDGGPVPSPPALSEEGGARPAPGPAEELTLCAETWGGEEEERAAEAGSGWAFEVGACFSEGLLAGMQPWEG